MSPNFDPLSLLGGSAEKDHRLAGLFLAIFGLELDSTGGSRRDDSDGGDGEDRWRTD